MTDSADATFDQRRADSTVTSAPLPPWSVLRSHASHKLRETEADALFEHLYGRDAPSLLRMAMAITGGRAAAEDAVHDGFVALHAHLRARRINRLVPYWLRRVVRNKAVDATRKSLRLVHGSDSCSEATEAPDPLRNLAAREAHLALAKALDRLPRRQRLAFEMRAVEGMAFDQMGEALRCSRDAARRLFGRAAKRLSKAMPGGFHGLPEKK